jgi:DNA adenine methylase
MKPILKWVGGKTQIIEFIMSEFPKNIHDYHEIFLGGGSVLFALLEQIKEKKIILTGKIYAYDLNEGLINVYKNIQDNHEILYENLQKLITDFNSINIKNIPNSRNENTNTKILTLADAKRSKSNYYYYIRNVFNESSNFSNPMYSAMFIFLNKTCFRGMFRVGPNGFNVPYGNYSNPEIINKEHLVSINLLIKDVKFECCDFKKSLGNVGTESTESTEGPESAACLS